MMMRITKPLTLASVLLAAGTPGLAASSAASTASASSAANPPSFGETVEVNVVNLAIYVTDRDGRRVTDLKKGDFAVSEDGRPVEVSNFAVVARAAAAPRPPAAAPPSGGPPAAEATAAAPAPDPENGLSLVVFVDDLHIQPHNRTRAVEQIRSFLSRTARPGDRVLLATHDTGLRVRQPFTEDAGAVDAALREVERLPTFGQQDDASRRTAYRAMVTLNDLEPCGRQMIAPAEGYAAQMRGEALRTIGALKAMINSLAGIPGRKALLFVSDGISLTPGEELFEAAKELCEGGGASGFSTKDDSRKPGSGAPQQLGGGTAGGGGTGEGYDSSQAALDAQKYSVAKQFEDLAAHASANRVTFYTLQASGLQGYAAAGVDADPSERLLQAPFVQQIQTSNLKGSLTALAVDTGGRAMLDVNDFLPELARMQEDFDSYYSLGYAPSHAGDGKVHHVEVKVKRAGLRVRYLQSYRDKPPLERMADRTLAALVHGVEDNPLEIALEIGDPTAAENGRFDVPVHLRIPLFKLAILNQQGNYQGKLRILVATRDEMGGASALRQVEVPLQIPRKEVLSAMGQYYLYTLTLKMKPGSQHVAVAVRDEIAAATSYLSRPVTVGAAARTAR
ncbi:MAG TPA: VWA domain-containing protein [Thermoanaerobaculia bacterium]